MTIEGQIEGIQKKTAQFTGELYMRVKMKGRTFITYDEQLMEQLSDLYSQYVEIEYSFFKGNQSPNVYRLLSVKRV